jgi:membrane-anchored mycosin MYCP
MRLRATITAALLLATIGLPALVATPAWAACPNMQISDPPQFTLPKDDSDNWVLARFGLSRLPRGVNGAGVVVAVLDSGVQPTHQALAGRVDEANGRDLLEASGATRGREDCRGHGTAVASVIAGNGRAGFRGIAPSARILPIRVNENEGQQDQNGRPTSDQKIADGIDWAIGHGADVINISFAYLGDAADPDRHRVFADAIKRAVDNDVIVVAAVGNDAKARDSFPANQPGVIGVGAINERGQHWPDSTAGPFVDVSAPGFGVIAAYPKNNAYQAYQGTSFAAPIVAGTVALLKQLHPKWKTADFIRQITATADRSPGGRNSRQYGHGVVDPVRAVTDQFAVGAAYQPPAAEVESEDPAIVAARQAASERRSKALWLALAAMAVSIIVLFSSSILRNGTQRRWRSAE